MNALAALSISAALAMSPSIVSAQISPEPQAPSNGFSALDYYPPAARAAGVAGKVTIKCGFGEHWSLKDCQVVAEAPAGYGFAAAAIQLAALSRENMKLDPPKPGWSRSITYVFSPNPPSISPDPREPTHLITNPMVLERPDAQALKNVYPAEARGSSGRVVVNCVVTLDGRLDPCSVLSETPSDLGFATAALRLAPSFKMRPMLYDGDPKGTGAYTFTIDFSR